MPISPTERTCRSGEQGFTLVELLVVVTIIALLSAAVVLVAPSGGTSLRSEAEQLAARARAAQEHAILANRAVALRLDESGYAFSVRSGRGWARAEAPPAGRWEEGTLPQQAGRVLFDAAGLSDPHRLVLRRGGESIAIDIGGDGEVRVGQPN
jgi:general secretion pathway protein H